MADNGFNITRMKEEALNYWIISMQVKVYHTQWIIVQHFCFSSFMLKDVIRNVTLNFLHYLALKVNSSFLTSPPPTLVVWHAHNYMCMAVLVWLKRDNYLYFTKWSSLIWLTYFIDGRKTPPYQPLLIINSVG